MVEGSLPAHSHLSKTTMANVTLNVDQTHRSNTDKY